MTSSGPFVPLGHLPPSPLQPVVFPGPPMPQGLLPVSSWGQCLSMAAAEELTWLIPKPCPCCSASHREAGSTVGLLEGQGNTSHALGCCSLRTLTDPR